MADKQLKGVHLKTFSAAIFDFDGTLFDTRKAVYATLVETFSSLGPNIPPPDKIHDIMALGINLEETFHRLSNNSLSHAEIDTYVSTYRSIYNTDVGIKASVPFDETKEALTQIYATETPIVVISNKGQASVQKILEHFDMAHFFHLIVATLDKAPTKPDPKSYFERVIPYLNQEACQKVLYVGDTEVDISYARNINITACWASYGYGDSARCRALSPDIIVDSVLSVARLFSSPHS
jgi:phosphoglycolate phosphatase